MPRANKAVVVVIIPTYNERGNIDRLVPVLCKGIFPTLPTEYDPHILVVDDNSPDGTGEEVRKLTRQYKNLHLLTNKRKAGLGKAYMVGMRYALDSLKADVVFQFDADFSHDPTRIPPMLEKLSAGYDLVLGSRYIAGGSIPDNWGLHRKFLSVVGNLIIRTVITYFSVHDWTTGYRALRREVIEKVLPQLNDEKFTGYTFQIGFLHKAIRSGFRVAEVSINFVDRTLGKSKLGAEYIKNTLRYIIKVRIMEILRWRIFRFVVVGGVGALVQLVALHFLRLTLPFQIAFFAAIECAVLSNFIWSNVWTFGDRALSWPQIPLKFIQFNMASAGSIGIQQLIAFVGERAIGLHHLFTLPVIRVGVDTGMVFAVVGILIGMVWNFFAYSTFIWRQKHASQ